MLKYFFISVLVLFFIYACADSNTTVYDYNDEENTLGLTVKPANSLVFTSEDINKSKDYTLEIDTNILELIGIDEAKSDYANSNFENVPKFKSDDCVETNGVVSCKLSILMKNTATEGSSGYVKLGFIYINDDKAEPESIKYHKFTFTYNNGGK